MYIFVKLQPSQAHSPTTKNTHCYSTTPFVPSCWNGKNILVCTVATTPPLWIYASFEPTINKSPFFILTSSGTLVGWQLSEILMMHFFMGFLRLHVPQRCLRSCLANLWCRFNLKFSSKSILLISPKCIVTNCQVASNGSRFCDAESESMGNNRRERKKTNLFLKQNYNNAW